MTATFHQPFDLLAETTAIAARQEAVTMANSGKSEIWLAHPHRQPRCRFRPECRSA